MGTLDEVDLGSAVHCGQGLGRSATVLAMESTQRASKPSKDAAAEAEAIRLRRLRRDAQRPMSVNLAETIALSHALLKMADAAQRR
jgi:protein-tyrosine phosphatase